MSADDKSFSRGLLGAAFASCVITSLPGFTFFLSGNGVSAPDLRALSAEIVLGSIAALFGSLQIQAQTRSSGKWIGLAPLAALAIAVGIVGVVTVFSVGGGSVDSGPVIFLGLLGVIAIVGVQMALAALTWFLLSELVKGLARDQAAGIDVRIRASKWLGVVAIIHVIVKSAGGGPSIFGLFAAVVAVSWAVHSKQNLGLVLGAFSIAASVIIMIGIRVYFTHKNALEALPECQGGAVASSQVLAMPGVADVLVYSPSPYGGSDLTVVVLPVGGGSISPAMKDAVRTTVMSSGCVVDTIGTRPNVNVVDPKYVEIPVVARVHLRPGANADDARKALIAVARDQYDPRVNPHLLRDPQSAGGETPSTPQDAGVQLVDWMSGTEDLGTKIDELEIGSVPVLGKLEIEIVADQ